MPSSRSFASAHMQLKQFRNKKGKNYHHLLPTAAAAAAAPLPTAAAPLPRARHSQGLLLLTPSGHEMQALSTVFSRRTPYFPLGQDVQTGELPAESGCQADCLPKNAYAVSGAAHATAPAPPLSECLARTRPYIPPGSAGHSLPFCLASPRRAASGSPRP